MASPVARKSPQIFFLNECWFRFVFNMLVVLWGVYSFPSWHLPFLGFFWGDILTFDQAGPFYSPECNSTPFVVVH